MTLIVALACKNGVVLASDGQVTTFSSGGPVRLPTSKIKPLGKHKLWSASGAVGIIQKISDVLCSLPQEIIGKSLNNPQLRQTILNPIHAIRKQELERNRVLYGQGRDNLASYADLIIVEYQNSNPKILHISPDCKDEFLEEFGYGCSGVGDIFAYTLLKNYRIKECPIERAALLAYRTIEDAINIGAYGLGEPIDLWIVDKDGIKQKSKSEMMGLREACISLREIESTIFGEIKI